MATDLSDQFYDGSYPVLTGGESEAATNSVSPIPPHGAPGSVSEATTLSDIVGTIGPVIPPQHTRKTMYPAGEGTPRYTRDYGDGSKWRGVQDESAPGDAAPGPWDQA